MTDVRLQEFANLLGESTEAERMALIARAKMIGMQSATPDKFERKSKFAGRLASGVEKRSVDWLWTQTIPLGALTMLFGPEGEGKSATTMMLVAMATKGELDGALAGKPCHVEIIAYEDDAEAVLVPRLEANGADLSMVTIHGTEDGDNLILPDDVPAFEEAVRERGSKLIIIDPLTDALREGLKDNNNGDVRKALVPLQAMAGRLGAAVVGVSHPNKSQVEAANRLMGSRAFRSVPRAVLIHGRDPDDLDGPTRVLAVSKSNYGAKVSHKLKLSDAVVTGVKGTLPKVEIVGVSEYRDQDLLVIGATGRRGDTKPLTKVEQGRNIILDLLDAAGGSIEASTAYAAGEAVGVSESQMRKARQGIQGLSSGTVWEWDEDTEPPLSM